MQKLLNEWRQYLKKNKYLKDKLSEQEIVDLLYKVGNWRGEELIEAVHIVFGESEGWRKITNENRNGSTDYGIWQFNNEAHMTPNKYGYTVYKIRPINTDIAFDPVAATKHVRLLFDTLKNKRGSKNRWGPWTGKHGTKYYRNLIKKYGSKKRKRAESAVAKYLKNVKVVRKPVKKKTSTPSSLLKPADLPTGIHPTDAPVDI